LPEAQQRGLAHMLKPPLLTGFGERGHTLCGMDAVGSGAVLREAKAGTTVRGDAVGGNQRSDVLPPAPPHLGFGLVVGAHV
jgi:hypothetical protein